MIPQALLSDLPTTSEWLIPSRNVLVQILLPRQVLLAVWVTSLALEKVPSRLYSFVASVQRQDLD